MYAEDDGSIEEFTRNADIRCGRAIAVGRGTINGVVDDDALYGSVSPMTKGYVQYSQPSLNGILKIPFVLINNNALYRSGGGA